MKRLFLVIPLLCSVFAVSAFAQRTVTGKVTTAPDGIALRGVRISVKGTVLGGVTDGSGVFRIANFPEGPRTLVFSLIGLLIVSGAAVFGLNLSNTGTTGGPSNSVPNVIGLTETEAKAQLGDYVVTVQRAHDPQIPVDRVANQVPVASAQARPGSAVVITISDGPGDALVPDGLIGLSLGDARAVLTSVGLVVARTEVSPSDKPQGTILAVTPEMGSTVTAGSGVVLTIANGEVEIPNLIGVDAIQARAILINSNFLIKEFNDYDATQAMDVVIRQFPEAGATRTIGESVTITINKAP